MKYKEYEVAFSPARLNRYKIACGGDKNKTMSLYRHNVKLCQKYYGVLNIFEIIVERKYNNYWLHFAVRPSNNRRRVLMLEKR